MEFSFVGIQRCLEEAIGPNHTFGGSSRESATAFPHTTQICDISSDLRPELRNLSNGRFKSGRRNTRSRRNGDQNAKGAPSGAPSLVSQGSLVAGGTQHPIPAIGGKRHSEAGGIIAQCKTSSNPSRPARRLHAMTRYSGRQSES
jgi:hypothetical protein